jgi:acetoin utilization deacetylase AcuC-like enzyme
MVSFIYSSNVYADLKGHVFPVEKYPLLADRLVKEGYLKAEEFIPPAPATREELLLVHTPQYLDDLLNLRWTRGTMFSEMPLSREIADFFVLTTGATIRACREALKGGIGYNIGGGFHHAFPDHAEGFCYLNDVGVGLQVMLMENLIQRAAVVDCDLHQGNGTAVIFQGESRVFTFSIHQEHLYPEKEESDLDIGLDHGTSDRLYLQLLSGALEKVLAHEPELVLFVAGADPYEHDQLGNLKLTIEGLKERDKMVIGICRERDIPLVITLAGGYAYDVKDTVQIHFNTALVALDIEKDENKKRGKTGGKRE